MRRARARPAAPLGSLSHQRPTRSTPLESPECASVAVESHESQSRVECCASLQHQHGAAMQEHSRPLTHSLARSLTHASSSPPASRATSTRALRCLSLARYSIVILGRQPAFTRRVRGPTACQTASGLRVASDSRLCAHPRPSHDPSKLLRGFPSRSVRRRTRLGIQSR